MFNAPGLLRFCLDRGFQLGFIEQMPLDAQHGWRRTEMITADEILAGLSEAFSLTPDDPVRRGSAPAETFLVDGGPDRVGVIGSGHPPVLRNLRPGPADRRRAGPQLPVRHRRDRPSRPAAVRRHRRPARLRLAGCRRRQASGHGISDPGFLQPARPMSAIGG
jgi:GTP 3',8-cyclase